MRTAIVDLLRDLAPSGVMVFPEASSEEGQPDLIAKQGPLVVGYGETKAPGPITRLERRLTSEQIIGYRRLPNLLLTDYVHFLLIRDGVEVARASLITTADLDAPAHRRRPRRARRAPRAARAVLVRTERPCLGLSAGKGGAPRRGVGGRGRIRRSGAGVPRANHLHSFPVDIEELPCDPQDSRSVGNRLNGSREVAIVGANHDRAAALAVPSLIGKQRPARHPPSRYRAVLRPASSAN